MLAMSQLGLFDLLADDRARTAYTIAEQLDADPRAIDICAHILAQSGLLRYENGMFRSGSAVLSLPKMLLQDTILFRQTYEQFVAVSTQRIDTFRPSAKSILRID